MSTFKSSGLSQEKTIQTSQNKKEYSDPLRRWPLVGLTYFNDLGAVVSGISPKVGYALRAPAMMYIGADIYDKYKNDENSYNPSKKRGLKQAIFIAFSGTILPSVIARVGENVASTLNRLSPSRLSTQTKEEILSKSLEYMQSNSLHTFENNIEGFKEGFKNSMVLHLQDSKGEFRALHPLKKALKVFNPFSDSDTIAFAKQSKVEKYAMKQAEKILTMRSVLMQNKKPKEMPKHLFKKFREIQTEYQRIYPPEKYLGKAAKTILKDFHKHQIFKNKLVKTAGGFVLITLLAKPIDDFVEKIVIKKTVEPGLDLISNGYASLQSYKDNHNVPKIFNCF